MALDQRVDRLERALADLAEAQARTERVLATLVGRVERLEDRMDRIEAALVRLAEAQGRAEERLARLEEAHLRAEARLARLEEAHLRAEARLARLEEAHLRAEERLARLEEAQIRTEHALQSSAAQVGRLSDVVGYSLEDLAREVTPAYLARHFGVDVPTLDRRFFTVDGEEIEIDFYGEGLRDGKPVAVVGEVRSCIYGRDVEAAVQIARRLIPLLPGPALPVLFGFVVHPSAREAAERTGAIVITSMGR